MTLLLFLCASTKFILVHTKVVYTVLASVSVWPLEWDILVPVNTSVPFRVYRKYIYIYIYIELLLYTFIHQNL